MYPERSGGRIFFFDCFDRCQIGHFGQYAIVRVIVCADNLQRELFFIGYAFLQADRTYSRYDQFGCFESVYDFHVDRLGLGHACCHDAFAFFAVIQVLPQFFGDEGHERMQHTEQCIEVPECSIVGFAVDRLLIGWFNHFEIPR